MDMKKTPLAVALFVEVLYLFCATSTLIAPEFIKKLYGGWFHGVSLEAVWVPEQVTLGGVITGMVTSFLFAYLAAVVFVAIYRAVARR